MLSTKRNENRAWSQVSFSCQSKQDSRCCIDFPHELTCQILTNQKIKINRHFLDRKYVFRHVQFPGQDLSLHWKLRVFVTAVIKVEVAINASVGFMGSWYWEIPKSYVVNFHTQMNSNQSEERTMFWHVKIRIRQITSFWVTRSRRGSKAVFQRKLTCLFIAKVLSNQTLMVLAKSVATINSLPA